MSGFFLDCLIWEVSRFCLIRFSITDLGTLVVFLIFGITNPVLIISKKRLVTISLFLSWLRSSSQFKIKMLPEVNRGAILVSSRNFSSADKNCEAFKSKVKTTFEATLLTFCPPAPELRTALNCNSAMSFSFSTY